MKAFIVASAASFSIWYAGGAFVQWSWPWPSDVDVKARGTALFILFVLWVVGQLFAFGSERPK